MPNIARVSNPPKEKTLMIYDGECLFCCRWIERWRRMTRDLIEYRTSQEVGDHFQEIPSRVYQDSVVHIDLAGNATAGSLAVMKSLANRGLWKWLLLLYSKLHVFARVSEGMYSLVAKNRKIFSTLEKWTIGLSVVPPTYQFSTWLFLRLLGLTFLVAFWSALMQILGLIGSEGILPISDLVQRLKSLDYNFFQFPTLAWFNSSDYFLVAQCVVGIVLSVFVIAGFLSGPALVLSWILYLSLAVAFRTFFGYQWDYLLLEVGFLSLFLVPYTAWRHGMNYAKGFSWTIIFLFRWLLFRLMCASGFVKLWSGDPTWKNLDALKYHYESQPLPTWLAWYAHQFPDWFQEFSCAAVFVIEIGFAFLIFAPRRIRFVAGFAFVLLMVMISLTGNYCFFNLLTVLLCLFLFDDEFWSKLITKIPSISFNNKPIIQPKTNWLFKICCLVIFVITLMNWSDQARWNIEWPKVFQNIRQHTNFLRAFNSYGLFASMTTKRYEIIVEGSDDGRLWKPYKLKYQPGDLDRAPKFNIPHQPRLDWQMWFAALGDLRRNSWMMGFFERLLQGSSSVLSLIEHNPFPDTPPRYIRALIYDYQFTNFSERKDSGHWWKRSNPRLYAPPMSLK